MANAFVEKLRGYAPVSSLDEALLEKACVRSRKLPADYDLIHEGDRPGPVFVILSGWACSYKILPGGSRQIISFLMPGDFCDIHVAVLAEMDHSIGTITEAQVATIPRDQMEELVEVRPSLAKAFWWSQLVDAGVLRATIVSMGRRTSLERVAHLLCELCFRMRNIGIATEESIVMPFTQIMLADAVGMTPVHVNRLVRKLRAAGALELGVGTLIIADLKLLSQIAGFYDNYLHRRLRTRQSATA
ncbi:Crp/Fnr family transcriptional regulator [Sphingomonas sp. PAMC26645]|uniref:Crp/Fnr family transcriptional regulator n=1 Tax=Sphingomonas sp. PAMC26645 TaxID=2565555 RepID=UPI00109DE178|nr:Crp/Fnr family transcriptional regulator [Sphingomonas sp. PAMC26645]QCB43304.1 Crp/Fnr family transcriptional regulator [Sphingomonas sp. PAMC26645]